MSALDNFFEKDGRLKDFTPLNKPEKKQATKEVKNRFKVSYSYHKVNGIITLSPVYSESAPFDCDSIVYVSCTDDLIRVRCREFGYEDEYKTRTWDRDQTKFKKAKKPRRISFNVPMYFIAKYYKVEEVPAGFNLIFEKEVKSSEGYQVAIDLNRNISRLRGLLTAMNIISNARFQGNNPFIVESDLAFEYLRLHQEAISQANFLGAFDMENDLKDVYNHFEMCVKYFDPVRSNF